MTRDVIVEFLLGALTVVVGFVSFLAATRSQAEASKTQRVAVDAAAYGRAQEIYEHALAVLQDELAETRRSLDVARGELAVAHTEIVSLRHDLTQLRAEMRKRQGLPPVSG